MLFVKNFQSVFKLQPMGDSTDHLKNTTADPEYAEAIETIIQPGGIPHKHRSPDHKPDTDQYNAGYDIAEAFYTLLLRVLGVGRPSSRLSRWDIIDICGP